LGQRRLLPRSKAWSYWWRGRTDQSDPDLSVVQGRLLKPPRPVGRWLAL
jgi:hypothetical protein